jgi:Amt family ammonium transporter
MTSAVCVIAIAGLIYFAFGFKVEGLPYSMPQSGSFFFIGIDGRTLAAAAFGLLSVMLCSLIPLGAAADRWRLSTACVSSIFLAGLVFPLFARFALSDFLTSVGSRFGSGGDFLDVAGSGFIQVTGGLTALSTTWLLGPRRGKYTEQSMPAAIPAHNGVFVLFGCLLAWVGWLGLNTAGAVAFTNTHPDKALFVFLNTTLSACAAALTAAAVTRIRFRKPDASLIGNGWMAGLVASSAGCATLKSATALLTGLVAGAVVVFSVEFLEFRLKVDDPCGSVSVHAVCGIWGLLAAGIFSDVSGQFMAQLVGVATLLGFIFPMTYGLNWLLNRFIPYRVSVDGERQGLDLHELGADAYPEFVVHTDEFIQR